MENYPHINEGDVASLRKMKKEELIALVCFFANRLHIHDEILKRLVYIGANRTITDLEFKATFKKNLEDFCNISFVLFNEYRPFVKKMQNIDGKIFATDQFRINKARITDVN